MLMLDGLSNQEIADKLVIGVRTVKFHITEILAKAECSSRCKLIVGFYKMQLGQRAATKMVVT